MAEGERNTKTGVTVHDRGDRHYWLCGSYHELIEYPDFDPSWLPDRQPKRKGTCRRTTYAGGYRIEAFRGWQNECQVHFMPQATVLHSAKVDILFGLSPFEKLRARDRKYRKFIETITSSGVPL